jgi:hypothetical protein
MSTLPDLLGVDAVLTRYGLRDRAATRRLMYAAGGFVVGGRVMVRADDLDRWERQQAETARRAQARVPRASTTRPRARRAKHAPPEPLRPGWWRTNSEAS